MFTLSVPEKSENFIFELQIITQTLNINNLRTKSAKSINLPAIRKLVEHSLKNVSERQCLFLTFSRYCCPKVGQYCDTHSGAQGAKGLRQYQSKGIELFSLNQVSLNQEFVRDRSLGNGLSWALARVACLACNVSSML